MVGCLFGTSSLPTLHFCCPPARKFQLSQPIHFAITISITQPIILTVSLLTADFHPHRLILSPTNQTYRFVQSTTHKFENLCIEDPDLQTDSKTGSAIGGMENADALESEKQKQKDSCRIMVEAATTSASTVLVSDTIYADKDILRVEDISLRSVQSLNETLWVLMNKQELTTATVLVRYTEEYCRPADNVRIDGKLIIFTLPSLKSDLDVLKRDSIDHITVQIEHENEIAECRIDLIKSAAVSLKSDDQVKLEKNSSSNNCNGDGSNSSEVQLHSLYAFASDGDPLALLAPMASLLPVPDADGCNALHIAARNKQNFALKTLLTAIREANDSVGQKKIIDAQNARGQTPLHCAVRAGDADCVHYLVVAGADKKLMDNENNMVTHYLGEVYNDAIYKEILESNVANDGQEKKSESEYETDVEQPNLLSNKNVEGYTPAHIAVRKLKLGLLEAFIEANAPVDIPDNNGETPLMCALQMDDTDIATLLIKNKCDVNAISSQKETPLMIACKKKNLLLIGRLLDAGADLNIPDKNGKLVKDIEDPEIQRILSGERIQPPEAHADIGNPMPSSSSCNENSETPRLSTYNYRIHTTVNTDDISTMDYLTRLRLSKLLDTEDKWEKLAEHLGCEHMVEFIRVCADETSSPTMILLDQYEQIPDANLSTVAKCLEEMEETAAFRLLRPPQDEQS